ncbi:unnamed protein product [Chrysoparadoxa australica]
MGEEGLSEEYIHSLASLGLDRLLTEPTRLVEEADGVKQSLQKLSLNNYRVFIENQDCVRHVRVQGKAISEGLGLLLKDLEGLVHEFELFQREGSGLVAGHKRNRQTLQHHMQLVELLEVPQLLDACVRNNLYEDALAIISFTASLQRLHSASEGPAPRLAFSECSKVLVFATTHPFIHWFIPFLLIPTLLLVPSQALRDRMLLQLQGPIPLTSCLQTVSCLRRLGGLRLRQQRKGPGGADSDEVTSTEQVLEATLQVEFLEARDIWFRSVLEEGKGQGGYPNGLPASNALAIADLCLMHLIEKSRTHWFDIATQYLAIFGAYYEHSLPTMHSSSHTLSDDKGAQDSAGGCGQVLSAWIMQHTADFLSKLQALLPLITDGTSLRSLLDQTMFFGSSMGRLGCDFRPLVQPIFESAVLSAVVGQWELALAGLKQGLGGVRAALDGAPSAPRGHSVMAPLYSPLTVPLPQEGSDISPLLQTPLLARFVNALLASMNQLRELAPLSLEQSLKRGLLLCCQQAANDLEKCKGSAEQAGIGADSIDRAFELWATLAVPHLDRCFCAIFAAPGEGIARKPLAEELGLGPSAPPPVRTPARSAAAPASEASQGVPAGDGEAMANGMGRESHSQPQHGSAPDDGAGP